MTRGRIWVGDWLRTWSVVQGTVPSSAAEFLVDAFQLSTARPPQVASTVLVAEGGSISAIFGPAPLKATAVTQQAPDRETREASESGRALRVQRLPDRVVEVVPDPVGALARPAERLPVRPVQSLFKRATERALVGAIVATWRPEGEIEIRRIVDALVRRRPTEHVPRKLVPTTRMGATLLIERAVAEPLADDVISLRRQIQRVVGISATCEWWLESGELPRQRGRRIHVWPPPPATPVIAIVMSPATLDRVAPMLAERRCPVIAVVPGRDASAARNVTVVGWDRRTTVAAVSRARRLADRR